MWQSGGSNIKKCQDIKPYGRNVASLRTMLKGRNVAENRYAADAVRMRLAGDLAWQSAAARAADALMDISEPDQKSSLLFGKNVVCKGAKAFEEYVKVLCGRSMGRVAGDEGGPHSFSLYLAYSLSRVIQSLSDFTDSTPFSWRPMM